MLFGFLFKSTTITYAQAFTYIGFVVMAVAAIVLVTRFYKVFPVAEDVAANAEPVLAPTEV